MIARYVAQSEDYMHSPTLEFETIQAAVQFEDLRGPPEEPTSSRMRSTITGAAICGA